MKAVLISIQPKWVEKIASGQKTIEVRKSRPKLETPFKCYIYETKGKKVECGFHFEETGRTLREKYVFGLKEARIVKHYCDEGHGKIIGEFVCDEVINLWAGYAGEHGDCCLTFDEIESYLGFEKDGMSNKMGYGWHISVLKIYDKPKELSEFYPIKPKRIENWIDKDACAFCKYHRWGKTPFEETCLLDKPEPICEYTPPLERPPQSWCYVEVER